jgi:succinyl-CoA synthetase beta subunit
MNLHEYQAKALFAEFGLPVPEGTVISSLSDVAHISGEGTFAVKAQIHAGGRGKAGGVKIVARPELDAAVSELLGQSLVTYQTTAAGQPVNQVLVEPTASIERELYLGAVIDRSRQRLVVMASTEGGVDIETVAANTPEKILTAVINPLTGVLPYQARELGFGLGLNGEQMKALNTMLSALVTMFQAKDLSLVEINPLVVSDGKLLCLDGKVALDDNALYRQPVIKEWHDKTQEDERELRAHEWDLNYVSLDGQIGCMVNGAGLAMATMDLIKLQGGNPANFLDVGGTATPERVAEALRIILSDTNVQAILVNIFGGIVRCDIIAEGIIEAVGKTGITVPLVVRLEGNNADIGAKLLAESDINVIVAENLTDAAVKAVEAVA